MVVLIKGEAGDIEQSHKDIGALIGAPICDICYNLDTIKKRVEKEGFDSFFEKNTFVNYIKLNEIFVKELMHE